jgi:prenyltransferase beta subunit
VTTLTNALNRKVLIGATLFTIIIFSLASSVSAISRKDAIMNFVNGCQKPIDKEGYYATNNNDTAKIPTLQNTYAAFEIIGILKAPITNTSYPNALSIQSFLADLVNSTGGYEAFDGSGAENLQSTFQALEMNKMLSIKNNLTLMNKHVNFTLKSQNANWGFGANPSSKSTPDIINTYFALKVLNITGNQSLVNMGRVHDFVLSCRKSNSMFAGNPASTDVSITATCFAVMLYNEFFKNETDLAGTKTAIQTYIASHRDTSGGFIDTAVDAEPLLSTTYYAVKLCDELVVDVPGGDDAVITWIVAQQSLDGGFIEGKTATATSTLIGTSFAVGSINILRATLADLNADTAWTLNQIGGIVAVVVLLGVIVALIRTAFNKSFFFYPNFLGIEASNFEIN